MTATLLSPENLQTDTWVPATWAEFVAVCDGLDGELGNDTNSKKSTQLAKPQCYFDAGWMRIETMGTGSGHGQDNTLLAQVVSLFCLAKGIRLKGFTNTSFRRVGLRECQPDLAFYIGADIPEPFPPKTPEVISIETYQAPTLAIEISLSTLSDDLGQKRLLYERLAVREYWVIDVENASVTAFAVRDGGSWQIQASQVLPNLNMSMIEAALRQSQTQDDTEVNRWLLEQFQR